MNAQTGDNLLMCCAIALACSFWDGSVCRGEAPPPRLSERAVILVSPERSASRWPPDAHEIVIGTGFIVESSFALFLVTATHHVWFCSSDTEVGIQGEYGPVWGRLGDIAGAPIEWSHARNLSAVKLRDSVETRAFVTEARRVSVAVEQLTDDLPERGTHVEIVGYPMVLERMFQSRVVRSSKDSDGRESRAADSLLSVNDDVDSAIRSCEFAAFVSSAYVSSTELTLQGKVRKAMFLSPTVPGGENMGGGPVFLRDEAETEVNCFGVYLGNRFDLADSTPVPGMVPARYLKELIEQRVQPHRLRQ